jgi:hypothetical protein
MSLEVKYKGEDLSFTIKRWEDEGKTIPVSLAAYDDLICYVYSSARDVKKFSRSKEGYLRYEETTAYEFKGTVPGSLTKKMATGNVTIEIFTESNGVEKRVAVAEIYSLLESEIKAEA